MSASMTYGTPLHRCSFSREPIPNTSNNSSGTVALASRSIYTPTSFRGIIDITSISSMTHKRERRKRTKKRSKTQPSRNLTKGGSREHLHDLLTT